MDDPVKLFDVVLKLLPGFIAAWVFHGLTSHKREGIFERVVHALIFTTFVQAGIGVTKELLTKAFPSGTPVFGPWTEDKAVALSVAYAIALGLVFAVLANSDLLHAFLRCCKLTGRTSYPSEWYSAFSHRSKHFLILYLRDGRRLYGWPNEWPDNPDQGHFVLDEPEWLVENGERIAVGGDRSLIVAAQDVMFVEFVPEHSGPASPQAHAATKGDLDGRQAATTKTTTVSTAAAINTSTGELPRAENSDSQAATEPTTAKASTYLT